MEYTNDFTTRVLSNVGDLTIKEKIINGELDIGDYLQENAFKGIDSRIVIECIRLHNLEYLDKLACRQERLKALYQEWFEYYVMRSGETLKQKEIDRELSKR